jgi:phosphomevalonate kinase
MNYLSYRVKVPGKLMIAGEYAVLERDYKAVVAAVNRYVTAHIKPSEKNKLILPQYGMENITWEINQGGLHFNSSDARLSFIKSSIFVASQFLRERSIKLIPFELQVSSELDDPSTCKKYGLGSSAAVVTAVISAVLQLHCGRAIASLEEIFKLSAIAHVKTQGGGSGADIAAAVYGGWLEYSAFSAEWVLGRVSQGGSICSILEEPWPYLLIRPIKPPPSLQLAVGWTGEPAATAPMIKGIQNFRDSNTKAYEEFLRESAEAVKGLLQSFDSGDCAKAINSVSGNRKALQKLGKAAGVDIETEKLRVLCSTAENFGSGKSSGAGGGDCGIAFLRGNVHRQELYKAWLEADIIPLDLLVSEKGVH